MSTQKSNDSRKNGNWFSLLSDFYIDLLGSLVPGIFTIILALSILIWSGHIIYHCLSINLPALKTTAAITQGYNILTQTVKLAPYSTAAILLVTAYILGFLFYRQDPKIPDYLSAQKIYNACLETERKRLAVQPRSKNTTKITLDDVQFPYFFLYEYLNGRGLSHLARWIPWQGENPKTWKYRTKMFINLFKIRLQFLIPERCRDIVRNEAHVRLATSVWYSTRWLKTIVLIALGFILITIIFAQDQWIKMIPVIFFDVSVLLFLWFIGEKITNFIHYLRVREIVYVLETAHFAEINDINLHPKDFLNQKVDEN